MVRSRSHGQFNSNPERLVHAGKIGRITSRAYRARDARTNRGTATISVMAHKHKDGAVVTRAQPRNERCPRLARRHRPESFDANQVSSPRWAPLDRSVPRLTQNRTAATGSGARRCRTWQGHPIWLNRDPIYEEGGINLYGFVRNRPVNLVDALGRDVWVIRSPVWPGHEWIIGDNGDGTYWEAAFWPDTPSG